MDQARSTAAIIAIVMAIGSFVLTFTGHAFLAMVAAIIAIPVGALGVFAALSPKVSGGVMSASAIIISLCAIGFAVLGLIVSLIF